MMKVSLQKILMWLAIGLVPAILFTGCESTIPTKNNTVPDKSSDVRRLARSGSITVSGKSDALNATADILETECRHLELKWHEMARM